jgi:hypothetical protein
VGELDLERAMGESIVEGPAMMQDKRASGTSWEELAAAERVVESLTVGKGKRKAAPTRAKVYGAVEGPVSNLPKSLSTYANTNPYSATNV